jgi:hypothetical protein
MNPHCRAPCLAQYSEAGYFYPVQFLWKGKTSAAGGAHCGVRHLRAPGGFPAAGRRSPSERRSLPAPPPAERHRRGRARPGRSTSRRAAPRAPAPARGNVRKSPGWPLFPAPELFPEAAPPPLDLPDESGVLVAELCRAAEGGQSLRRPFGPLPQPGRIQAGWALHKR